jgi:HlyD family secretion protein
MATSVTTQSESSRSRKNGPRKWLRRGIVLAVAAVLITLGVISALPKPTPVDVVSVRRGPLRVTVDEAGKFRVRDRFVVSAAFAGSLSRIELRAGDAVDVGQTLATIVPAEPPLLDARTRASAEARVASSTAVHRQSEATVRRAEIALKDATQDLDKTKKLADSGSLSRDALEHAELELRLRQEELSSAKFATQVAASEINAARAALGLLDPRASQNVEAIRVPSPVKGRVLRVLHPDAGVVAAGTPLVEVGDPEALEFAVDVLTADATRIKPGARTTLVAWGGAPIAAHVRRVEPSAFTRISALGVEEQRVNVVIDLDADKAVTAKLGDGWRAEARIVVEQKEDALVVPAGAVFTKDGQSFVYVDQNGRAVVRPVTREVVAATEIGVTGLAEGQRVLVHPSEHVSDGVRIAPR